MLVLDTDRVTEYQRGTSAEARRLKQRLEIAAEPFATTIVTVEEILRGWMAAIHRIGAPRRQVNAYGRLQHLFRFFATWNVLAWTESAADYFESWRGAKVRIGTMDLKIAGIVAAANATLLTRNMADFNRVPGLRVEDWLS